MELDHIAGNSAAQDKLRYLLENAVIPNELAAPVPGYPRSAQEQGIADFHAHSSLLTRLPRGLHQR
ncbi:hypothetical protein ACLMAL_23420 [Nocardia sp. CWNU-33]|uniref:hypothetical protein n=1 Tax=Nocardia sp. CWNU-33 TaxID=3392117 RepID=UPI00398F3AD1